MKIPVKIRSACNLSWDEKKNILIFNDDNKNTVKEQNNSSSESCSKMLPGEKCACVVRQVRSSGDHKSAVSNTLNVRLVKRSIWLTFLPSPLQAFCPSVSSNSKPEPKPRPLQSTRRKYEESGSVGTCTGRTDVWCIPAVHRKHET